MAAMREVPDATGQKMAVGTGHRLSPRSCVLASKRPSKRLGHCYFAILCRQINKLLRSDPALAYPDHRPTRTSYSDTGSSNPLRLSAPRCSNSKPFPATSWRTTSETNTRPGCARSQRRLANCTEVPNRSSPSVIGSPALRPIRILTASSGLAVLRAANIF
jgi:hypothetical protein